MEILFVYADQKHEMNCSVFNCFNPTEAINKTGVHTANYIHVDDFVKNEPETQKLCSEADIIVIERNFFQDVSTMEVFWWTRGQNIGGIWDDGYSVMHPKNPAYPFWNNGEIRYILKDQPNVEQVGYMSPKPLVQMKYSLHFLKGAQVVSDALIEDWSPYVDCYKINNHLVIDRYTNVTEPLYPHDGIWIGWTGSLSHRDSFESSGLLRAYRKICKNFPTVKILITGDKKIYDELDVPNTRKMFSGYVPAEQYPSLIKSLDICTIPLAGEYDKRRSQIKPLECLALKVPFIATNYPNYNHLAPYGTFTENGWQNWENAIAESIEKLSDLREKAVDVGYPFALTQDIDLHVQERIDLYQMLIDKPYRY